MTSTWLDDDKYPPGYLPPDVPRDVRVPDRRRSLGGLASTAQVLVSLCAVAGLVSGYASYRRAQLFDDLLAGRPFDFAVADAADTFVSLAIVADLALYVPAGVVFIIWFWRLAKNSALLDRHQAPGAGWAIGSWFVPIGNYWLPALNLIRADRVSGRAVDRDSAGSRRLIVTWAVAFGASIAASTALWRAAPYRLQTRADVEAFARADRYDILPQLGFVIAAVLAVLMIRRLTERQDLAFVDQDTSWHEAELRRAHFVAPAGYAAPIDPRDAP